MFLAAIIAAVAAIASPAQSQAGFDLTLPDATVVGDGGTGLINYINHAFAYNGGVYDLSIQSNNTDLSTPLSEGVNDTIFKVKLVSGTVTTPLNFSVEWSPGPSGPNGNPLFFISSAELATVSHGSATVHSQVSPPVTAVDLSVSGTFNDPTGRDTKTVLYNRSSTPSSIKQTFAITLSGNAVFNMTSHAEISAAPAPATAILALAGAPIFGVFGWMRRRKAVVA
jgi:hypothetical protein